MVSSIPGTTRLSVLIDKNPLPLTLQFNFGPEAVPRLQTRLRMAESSRLRVVATASRPETRQWCLDLGAHVVIDHSRPLAAELKAAGVEGVELVASLTQTLQHYPQIIEALKPQGRLGVIDDMQGLDAMPLKSKALSLHWELMFTRPMYETPDMAEQGALLAEVAALVDTGRIRSTASTSFGTINAQNLRKAHALIESGKAHGKVVLAGF